MLQDSSRKLRYKVKELEKRIEVLESLLKDENKNRLTGVSADNKSNDNS